MERDELKLLGGTARVFTVDIAIVNRNGGGYGEEAQRKARAELYEILDKALGAKEGMFRITDERVYGLLDE